ncbi:MAG: sigma-54 dependent transcriptional regulator [Muribaculaceae bacterium]|nr:sigma-54 dependent transcriptional regulator [Muribaculaceae bacterium]
MILIVDDDSAIRATLTFLLRREGLDPVAVASPDEALPYFRRGEPSLALMDMNFSRSTTGEEGLHLLRQARIFMPHLPVILITAWGSIDLAVEGMRAGAFDFITKPWDSALLLSRIHTALALSEAAASESAAPGAAPFDRAGIIGRSPALTSLLSTVERVAPSDAPVLILGENGTGKELIARALHINSRRASRPFVEVNLGGIPSALFESEMFGHVKGAFTGAVASRRGRFEEADGGTIFLDEIGDLDPSAQVKMLRVLQEHTFQPLGDSRTRKADFRVVSATNADLSARVADRSFREDLFYRINLITLRLPPLRERREDIPLLVNHFLHEGALHHGVSQPEMAPDAMTLLCRLPYPGNIRQLKNMVERAMLVNVSRRIEADAFRTEAENAARSEACTSADTSHSGASDPGATLADLERNAIRDALERHGGNLTTTALSLGITRQALYRKMEKFNLSK